MRIQDFAAGAAVMFALTVLAPGTALAHCDGLDGPVVKAAQRALDTGNLVHVLIWVRAEDEPEIRDVFEKTVTVRGLSQVVRELADRHFFETVVRVHRVAEGASYTGLKPGGRDLGPAIPAADKALDEGSADTLVKLLSGALEEGLRRHFEEAVSARSDTPDDVEAGRHYVKAYVEFIHYVERLHEAIATTAHGHFAEPAPAETRQ